MPPKGKKKKTKEELEEERRLAEEAARLAEEERLRLEEEERQRLAELEARRQELLSQLLDAENNRLEAEQDYLQPLFGQLKLERSKAEESRAKAEEWERFITCVYVPHPKDIVTVSNQLKLLREQSDVQLSDAMTTCQDCYTMIDEAVKCKRLASLTRDTTATEQHSNDIAALHEVIGLRMDRITAHVLQHADLHQNEKGEIQLGNIQGSFQWSLWVNTSKNPRLKAVEMSALHMLVEVPKQIALANIAMRVQRRDKDEFLDRCSNEFMAVGGVLYVDLLALPPPAKHVKMWVLRQITPFASNVVRVPYPIPPAGADPATYRSDEETPPLGFAMPFPMDVVLLDNEQIKVGWWDAEAQAWSQQGVSDVQLDAASGSLSFRTTHLGSIAVIQSRVALLPYTTWNIRPTGGKRGNTAVITLVTPGYPEPIQIEVGPGWCSLAAVPGMTALAALFGVQMTPEQLLVKLSEKGLHLMPEDRDAQFSGVTPKAFECESAMCYDLALLAGTFLISKSRWNQAAAAPDECIVRISEVTDWEGGGRTEARHLERIFSKEKEEGDRRVLSVIRRGAKGVAFTDALDKRPEYAPLPTHDSVESVQACLDNVWGEVHASLVSLLWANLPDTEPSTLLAAAPSLKSQQSSLQGEDTALMSQPSTTSLAAGAADEEEEQDGEKQDEALKPQQSVKKVVKKPGFSAPLEDALVQRLSATAEGYELVTTTDAVFSETVAKTLLLLRVFSFS